MSIAQVVNFAAAIAAMMAGVVWWLASRVKYPEATMIQGLVPGGLSRANQHELVSALSRSGKLNCWAALAASVAAILSGLGILLG